MTPANRRGEDLMTERWLSVDEIAAHLGIGRETVYRWIDQKGLPAHRMGKFWKFKVSEVDAWVQHGDGDSGSSSSGNDESSQEKGTGSAKSAGPSTKRKS